MFRHTHILRQAEGREGPGARVPAKEIAAAGEKFALGTGGLSGGAASARQRPLPMALLPGSFHDSPFQTEANPKAEEALASQRKFGFDD